MFPELRLARSLESASPSPQDPGKLVELSGNPGSARVSAAVAAVHRAQLAGETAAWIQPERGALFPPDLAECGVDLAALAVVHVPGTAGPHAPFRAAELLLRSGAFGLLVLDLRESRISRTEPAWQGRLLGLAREHDSRVLFLTTKLANVASLGPLVSLRLEPQRVRVAPGTFRLEPRILKNKAGHLGETVEIRRGPWGLR